MLVERVRGLTPKNSNPHNSGPEVDIDFVLTAFFIVRRGLIEYVLSVRQMAPLVCNATPPKGLNPHFSEVYRYFFAKIHQSIVPMSTIDGPKHMTLTTFWT